MSDLSNQQVPQEEVFNADAYVRLLCENTKIIISDYLIIQFQPGWKNVVADLIESIKGYPIQLTQITDSYSILEVKFNVLKVTREINVWRAIERSREESQLICAQCGGRKVLDVIILRACFVRCAPKMLDCLEKLEHGWINIKDSIFYWG